MRYLRAQLLRWFPACLAIIILFPLRVRGSEIGCGPFGVVPNALVGAITFLAQDKSGKVSTRPSTLIVEECRYNSAGNYVCEDVVKEQPGQRQGVAKAAPPSVVPQTATASDLDTAEGQKNSEPLKDFNNDRLIRRRDTLQKGIRDVSEQLKSLRDIRMYLPQLKTAKDQHDTRFQSEIEKFIAENEGVAGLELGEGQKFSAVTRLTRLKENDLHRQEQELERIDSEISHRLNIEAETQTFKKLMSALFAGIVALVILGFFIVALRDPKVRQDIFAGQAGIQFITLFSLVIAIILFGITGVLEGKELAALLGGLAGYILGRSGFIAAPSATGQRSPREDVPPGEHDSKEEVVLRQAAANRG